MQNFDYIFAGGGLAGLTLACTMQQTELKARSILIIDQDSKKQNDHTWSFWIDHPMLFDPAVSHVWDCVEFFGSDFDRRFSLSPFQYKTILAKDFYRVAREMLPSSSNVRFLRATVDSIEEKESYVLVTAGGQTYACRYLFNSIFKPSEFHPDQRKYHSLKQHFRGWEIETEGDAFNEQCPALFDFRTPQRDCMRFFYVLPYSKRNALVEYTLFSFDLLSQEEYEAALKDYVDNVLHLSSYHVTGVETGIIPMTDYPFERRSGYRILNIGTAGGRVKPSSGYAFLRILKDSENIVNSIKRYGDPYHIPPDIGLFRTLDSTMLQLMYRRGGLMKGIFTGLFKNNPIPRIFRFLNEETGLLETLLVISSVPPMPFLQAWFKLKVLKEI
jgi:lycopene beta-cyclase